MASRTETLKLSKRRKLTPEQRVTLLAAFRKAASIESRFGKFDPPDPGVTAAWTSLIDELERAFG